MIPLSHSRRRPAGGLPSNRGSGRKPARGLGFSESNRPAPRIGSRRRAPGRRPSSSGARPSGSRAAHRGTVARLLSSRPRSAALSRPGIPSGPMQSLQIAGRGLDAGAMQGLASWLDGQGAHVLASLVRSHRESLHRIGNGASGLIIG